MNKEELMPVFPLLAGTAPSEWVEIKLVYQYESNMARFFVFYKSKTDSSWVRGNFGGFELLDFFDSIKANIDLKEWPQLEICVDRNRNLRFQLISESPDFFDGH